jgi:predicted Co/Zn/Cd cation transporter (cation efflux family)
MGRPTFTPSIAVPADATMRQLTHRLKTRAKTTGSG